jgi:hypothetical protein
MAAAHPCGFVATQPAALSPAFAPTNAILAKNAGLHLSLAKLGTRVMYANLTKLMQYLYLIL